MYGDSSENLLEIVCGDSVYSRENTDTLECIEGSYIYRPTYPQSVKTPRAIDVRAPSTLKCMSALTYRALHI